MRIKLDMLSNWDYVDLFNWLDNEKITYNSFYHSNIGFAKEIEVDDETAFLIKLKFNI